MSSGCRNHLRPVPCPIRQRELGHGRVGDGSEEFVIARVNGVYLNSCYAPPRRSIEQSSQMVDRLTAVLGGLRPVVIAGDLNAWAVEWASHHINQRGRILLEAMAKLDVVLANTGSVSTYRRNGAESVIDVTYCSPCLEGNLHWRVDEGYIDSDHQAIRYSVGQDVLSEALRWERITPDLTGEELVASLTRACDTTMPRRAYPRHDHIPVYWWSESIDILRASCLQARRRMQRARTAKTREERRAAKAALNKEIARRKRACYDSLCQSANMNAWGDAYKVVMAKTSGVAAPPERSPAMLASIVEFLFPRRDVDSWPRGISVAEQKEVSRVTNSELIGIAKSLVVDKAPGQDGIPVVALRAAVAENSDMFRSVFQTCLGRHLPRCVEAAEAGASPEAKETPWGPVSIQAHLFAGHNWQTA
ncbi:uncharacterized protein LOC135711747 [Ochlerotatus camptorhynchus]|uniref:uncharacterized protein LOC135711747 n=1 Tax=Ochlerotatus camptorhynchus TaxID=644619 RepID=UPI0031D29538